jgi:hypothetical protein
LISPENLDGIQLAPHIQIPSRPFPYFPLLVL